MRKKAKRAGFSDRHIISATLALLLFFFYSSVKAFADQKPSAPASNLVQLSAQAQQAQRQGDYRRAAAIYREMLERQPHIPEVRSNLGLMQHFLGEYKEAISSFDLALRENPQLYVANLFLGVDLLNLHEPQKALPFLERACNLNKQDAQAKVALAVAYKELGKIDKARSAYEAATQIDPKSSDAWYGLGAAYLELQESAVNRLGELGEKSPYARDLVAHALVEQGLPDAAVNLYRELLKAHATVPCLKANLGFAYVLSGNLKSAEEAFIDQVKGQPGCLLARLGLARISLEHRNTSQAFEELFGVWTTDEGFLRENLPTLWAGLDGEFVSLMKTSCARFSGSQQKVLFAQFLASAIQAWLDERNEPGSLSTVPSTGNAKKYAGAAEADVSIGASPETLLSQGHYAECKRSLQARRSRVSPADLNILCECAYYSGDYWTSFLASGVLAAYRGEILPGQYWRAKSAEKLGVAALRQAGLAAPDSPRVHFLLAELYRQQWQEAEAESEYRKVIELRPDDVAAHIGLAHAYCLSMQFDKALPELKVVLTLDSKQPDANYLMGNILVNQHQFAEAMPYLETALKVNASKAPLVYALISRVYASQGRTTEAVSELRQALEADQDGSLHFELSLLYRKLDDQKAAAAALEQSKTIFRQNKGLTRQPDIMEFPNSESISTSQEGIVHENSTERVH